jgi:hypothetical protein
MSHPVGGLNTVRELALALPDVKENVTKLGTGWKVKGRLMACEAIHKSAESNSIMVRISTKERARLIKAQPDIYYLTDHYRPYDAILVRLAKSDEESLREILESSWRFVCQTA